MKSILLTTCLSLVCLEALSQIQINAAIPPATLVQDSLIGNGIQISNVTFSGNPNQIGAFNGQNSTIGLSSGVVLSSGDVSLIPTAMPSTDYFGAGDPDLLAIAQSVVTNPNAATITATFDAAVLEFDFVPQGDSVSFNFVFASEEYLMFVNSQFNDVFGFFLSGPGIIGPYVSPAGFPGGAINLASVPGSALPITISTIYPPGDYDFDGIPDPGFNDQFYIDNPTDNTHGFNGFTSVIPIGFDVICGETYHFKFAIADCEDGTLDTGVFIESGSFESEEAIAVNIATETGDTMLVEGCTGATITITRPIDQIADSTLLVYDVLGEAVNNSDYTGIPAQMWFLPGQDTLVINIESIDDLVSEGAESIILSFTVTTPCGTTEITDTLFIIDAPDADFTENLSSGCAPLAITLSNSSINSSTYFWDFGDGTNVTTQNTLPLSHTFNTTSTVTLIASYNGFCADTATTLITVFQPPVVSVNSPSICIGDTATLLAQGAETYQWNPGSGMIISNGETALANPGTTTNYTVVGTDSNGCSSSAVATVTVEFVDVLVNDATICAFSSDQATLVASGALTYDWSPADWLNTSTGSTVIATPPVTTDYIVTGTTQSGCTDTAIATVTVIPDFTLTVNSDSICPGEVATLQAEGAVTYTWSPASYLNTAEGSDVIASPPQTITYTLTGEVLGCQKSVTSTVLVYPAANAGILANPTELTPTETELTLTATQPNNLNTWFLDGSVVANQQSFSYTLPENPGNYNFLLVVENSFGCKDSTSITIPVKEEVIFYVPNAFTPDGDEYNNTFCPVLTSGIDLSSYELMIFNRWGELIFESRDVSIGWDGTYHGKLCNNGTYTWVLGFKSKYTDMKYNYEGHVTIQK